MRFSHSLAAGLAMLVTAVSTQVASAGDWPYWRGPEQNGISRERNLPTTFDLAKKENIAWEVPIGGRATPVILNGRVFLNCRTTDDVNDPKTKVNAREQVVCFDLATGKEVWKDVFNVWQTDIPAPRVGWASMVGDPETGFVYMHSVSGLLRCYDRNGKKIWEHSLFETFGKISGYGGRTQTPIIDEGRLILGFMAMNWGATGGPPPKMGYYAFDKKTGKLLWKSIPSGRPLDTNYSNPIVSIVNGKRLLIGGNSDGGVYAINARTGKFVWKHMMSKRGLNTTPTVDGGLVFISHGEDNNDNVVFGRVEALNAATGKSEWRVDGVKAGYTALVAKDGILYVVADTGSMHAFDTKSGKQLWKHSIGTVGKGSPVWADGKIYGAGVNGNFKILEPGRDGCKELCHVRIKAGDGKGYDEIYSSPAISNGRIVVVTRDRTFCIFDKNAKTETGKIPAMPAEAAPQNKVALVQLWPAEVVAKAGKPVKYQLACFDENGRHIKTVAPKIVADAALKDAGISGDTLTFKKVTASQAGLITAEYNGMKAVARVRAFAPLPWSFDFNNLSGIQVPSTWNAAKIRFKPGEVDGQKALGKAGGKGRPSAWTWIGTEDMKNYTIQADVYLEEKKFRMPDAGIINQRYSLILAGNDSEIKVQSWQPHLRMARSKEFEPEPETWYTLKLTVSVAGGKATVKAKVWERDEKEPADWTLVAEDPNPNLNGAPGLYTYSTAQSYFDNVKITANKK